MRKLPKMKYDLQYDLQYGYYKLFCPYEMNEIGGRALNSTETGGSQIPKISSAKEMNNLEKKRAGQKDKDKC